MDGIAPYIGVVLVGIIVGFGVSVLFQRIRLSRKVREAEERIETTVNDAKREADAKIREAELEAKDIAF